MIDEETQKEIDKCTEYNKRIIKSMIERIIEGEEHERGMDSNI